MAVTYATLNPSDKSSYITLSNGNLTMTNDGTGGSTWGSARSTVSVTSGKWFWETKLNTIVGGQQGLFGIGLSTANLNTYVGTDANGWGYFSGNGDKVNNNSFAGYGATFGLNDVIGTALDMDGGTVTMYLNGVSQGTMYTGLTGAMFAMNSSFFQSAVGDVSTVNFGATAFAFTVPSGYNPGLYTGSPTSNSAMMAFF